MPTRMPTRSPAPLIAALLIGACGGGDRPTDDAPDVTRADITTEETSTGDTGDVSAAALCELPAGALVALPADDARHDAAVEWFYWTGHLEAADGRHFGLHITVLVSGPPGNGISIVHHSLTVADDAQPYRHAVEFGRDDRSPAAGFEFDVGNVRVRGFDGVDHVESDLPGSRLVLDVVDVRGPVARHGTGFKDYGAGISTFYYARPRMRATGTLELGDETIAVTGTLWFDHQWGDIAPAAASRWDWIGLTLDDGREVMVALVPNPAGGFFGEAEVTDPDCGTTRYETADITLVSKADWTSPTTGCAYPSGWVLTVGAERFEIEPVTVDQEVQATPLVYWEGAATVSGDATGRAYVELVGYCPLR